jgi:DNA helicase-2/ATP-dependent DNA helicase PcrA
MSAGGVPPLAALRDRVATFDLPKPAQRGAAEFLALLDELAAGAGPGGGAGGSEMGPDTMLRRILERTAYLGTLDAEEQAEERRANVEELVGAAAAFATTRGGTLADFLAEVALVSDADRIEEGADRILLLTAHNAKGLEFPVVIVAGLEEGLFPHAVSSADEAGLEEERRLFYVALTRAADEVLLTAAAYRRRFDGPRGAQVSRFVGEIPEEVLERETTPGLYAQRHRVGEGNGRGLRVRGLRPPARATARWAVRCTTRASDAAW